MRLLDSLTPERLVALRELSVTPDGGRIRQILPLQDALIVLADSGLGGMVSIMDPVTGRVTGGGLPRKKGWGRPREFISLGRDPSDARTFWVFDFTGHRYVRSRVNADRSLAGEDHELVLKARGPLGRPAWMGARIVSLGYQTRGLFTTFDSAGIAKRLLGMPAYDAVARSLDLHHHLNYGFTTVSPRGDHLAVAYQTVPRLDLVSPDGTPTARFEWPTPYEFPVPTGVKLPDGTLRFVLLPTSRAAFLDVTSSDEYVYALFGGELQGRRNEAFSYGTTVLQLRWDGSIVARYTLPAPAMAIAVSVDDAELYASGKASTPVFVYSVPRRHTAGAVTALRAP